MAAINISERNLTLAKIDEAIIREKTKEAPRNYLGMSEIGHECWRYLFYSFRGCAKRNIDLSIEKDPDVIAKEALGIRRTGGGHIQEDIMAERLRLLPYITLYTKDPNNEKEQIGFQLLLNHFSGHLDGMIKGIIEAPATWHVWENKACGDKKFTELENAIMKYGEKEALYNWNIVYYAQAQTYMLCSQTERHYLTVVDSGGIKWTSVRTEFNRKYAESLIEKAKTIIFDNWNIPPKMNQNREFFQCKWCHFQGICHDGNLPDVNCRSCRYREPVQNGENKCLLHKKIIEKELLNSSCSDHIYNPAIVPAKMIEHQDDGCIYKTENGFIFANTTLTGMPDVKGKLDGIYTSLALRNDIKNVNSLNKESAQIVKTFDGAIETDGMKAWEKQKDAKQFEI